MCNQRAAYQENLHSKYVYTLWEIVYTGRPEEKSAALNHPFYTYLLLSLAELSQSEI